MTRSTVNKRYWSGIKNVHRRLNNTDSDGVNARKKYLELTGRAKYKEKNFQKAQRAGKTGISLLDVRRDFASIRNKKKDLLKKEYKQLKKDGMILDSQAKFIKNNLHEDSDWQDVRELFNSPS